MAHRLSTDLRPWLHAAALRAGPKGHLWVGGIVVRLPLCPWGETDRSVERCPLFCLRSNRRSLTASMRLSQDAL